MSRTDDLLARALSSGEIPPEASEAERAELAPLLAAAARMKPNRASIEREAAAAMPIARARFERFVETRHQQAAPLFAEAPRGGFLGRLVRGNRLALSLGGAVAVAAIAIVALFGSQALLSGTETANALSADDYVQVQGVVSSATTSGDQQTVLVNSELGAVTVLLSPSTSTVDETNPDGAASLKAGDTVLVGGVVTAVTPRREIAASTVAISQASIAAPRQVKLKELKKLLPNLQGRIGVLSVAKDGHSARVLIEAASGERYIVRVDGATAEALLRRSSTAIGTEVSVSDGDVPNDGVFALEEVGTAGGASAAPSAVPGAARPGLAFAGVKGVIAGREANVVEVIDADRKTVLVTIRANTRILFADSGLTLADIGRPGPLMGHTVAVSGGIDARTGRISADVIVIGPKLLKQ
jgi:hypothetical protein